MWKEGQGLPADGWYGGDVSRMIANGTYADFRPKIVRRVEEGFYADLTKAPDERVADSKKKLEKWDKEWDAIPIEERKTKRQKVVENSTPKPVQVRTTSGKKTVFLSKPSDDGEMERKKGRPPRGKVPSGTLTEENNPLISELQPA